MLRRGSTWRGAWLASTVVSKCCIDPPNIEVQVVDGVLHLLSFEAMQVRDFFMFPGNTFCKRLLHAMDVTLGAYYFEHQRSFLDLFGSSTPSR